MTAGVGIIGDPKDAVLIHDYLLERRRAADSAEIRTARRGSRGARALVDARVVAADVDRGSRCRRWIECNQVPIVRCCGPCRDGSGRNMGERRPAIEGVVDAASLRPDIHHRIVVGIDTKFWTVLFGVGEAAASHGILEKPAARVHVTPLFVLV